MSLDQQLHYRKLQAGGFCKENPTSWESSAVNSPVKAKSLFQVIRYRWPPGANTWANACTHRNIHVHIHTYLPFCMHTQEHTCTHTHISCILDAHTEAYMYTCTHIFHFACTHRDIHVHTHIVTFSMHTCVVHFRLGQGWVLMLTWLSLSFRSADDRRQVVTRGVHA